MFAKTRLEAVIKEAQRAEKLIKETTSRNRAELAALLTKKAPQRAKERKAKVAEFEAALKARAKRTTPAQLARQTTITNQAKARAAKATAAFNKALAEEQAAAGVATKEQKAFADAEAEIKLTTSQIKATRAKLTGYQKAKDKKSAHKASADIKEYSKKRVLARKRRAAAQQALMANRDLLAKLSAKVAKARARKLKADATYKNVQRDLVDKKGSAIPARLAEMRKKYALECKKRYAEEDKADKAAAKKRLEGVIATIRTAEDAAVAAVEKLILKVHHAKVAKFIAAMFIADALDSIKRATAELSAARQATAAKTARLQAAEKQAVADTKRREQAEIAAKTQSTRLGKLNAKLDKLKRANAANLQQISKVGAKTARGKALKAAAGKTNGQIVETRKAIATTKASLKTLIANARKAAQAAAKSGARVQRLRQAVTRLSAAETAAEAKLKQAQNKQVEAQIQAVKANQEQEHAQKVLVPQLRK